MTLTFIFLLAPGEWVAIGILCFTIITSLLAVFFRAGKLVTNVDNVKETIGEVKIDIKELNKTVPSLVTAISIFTSMDLLGRKSPLVLNELGEKILKESKVDKIIHKYYTEILTSVKNLNPENAYQAQQYLIKIVKELQYEEKCMNELEAGAFNSGYSVDTILLIGAIHIRDKIIEELGFTVAEIDKHDPEKKKKK